MNIYSFDRHYILLTSKYYFTILLWEGMNLWQIYGYIQLSLCAIACTLLKCASECSKYSLFRLLINRLLLVLQYVLQTTSILVVVNSSTCRTSLLLAVLFILLGLVEVIKFVCSTLRYGISTRRCWEVQLFPRFRISLQLTM